MLCRWQGDEHIANIAKSAEGEGEADGNKWFREMIEKEIQVVMHRCSPVVT